MTGAGVRDGSNGMSGEAGGGYRYPDDEDEAGLCEVLGDEERGDEEGGT